MTHYFCEECGNTADAPGVCTTEGCAKKGHELKMCDCEVGAPAHKKDKDMGMDKGSGDAMAGPSM